MGINGGRIWVIGLLGGIPPEALMRIMGVQGPTIEIIEPDRIDVSGALECPAFIETLHAKPAFNRKSSQFWDAGRFDDRMVKATQPHYGARMHARTYPK